MTKYLLPMPSVFPALSDAVQKMVCTPSEYVVVSSSKVAPGPLLLA